MPPHHPPPHRKSPQHEDGRQPPRPRDALAASQVLNFVDEGQMDAVLAALVPDAVDRAFVLRCLVGEGPLHHRGANYILLTLLAQVANTRMTQANTLPAEPGVQVPMRLPPYLAETVEEGAYPLLLPTGALHLLAKGDAAQVAAMVDCLTDGPPQHALANVVMVSLIEKLLSAQTTP